MDAKKLINQTTLEFSRLIIKGIVTSFSLDQKSLIRNFTTPFCDSWFRSLCRMNSGTFQHKVNQSLSKIYHNLIKQLKIKST